MSTTVSAQLENLDTDMIVLKETDHYKIYWHDNEQTIIVGEVYPGWTWDSAQEGLDFVNTSLEVPSQTHPTYTIIQLTTGAQLLPRGQSTLMTIRNLVQQDPGHETLTIFVTQFNIINTLMKLASRLYSIGEKIRHYRFVSTMADALRIIKEHDSQNN